MFAIHLMMRSTREKKKNLQFFVGGLVRLALSEDDDRKEKKNCRQKEEKKNQLAGQGPKD